ncbi:MAG: SDR family oxidoreductase [Gemmatimonadales bacterium]|jgi:nucleoside-diphosphate-sugar epimerase|nr:SDR family oxidoreductase [Gemmatimonadales bacterium]
MSPRKCLVTGGMGYVGQVVVRRLSLSGWEVLVADPNPFRMRSPLGASRVLPGLHSLSPADVEGCECIVHLAAVSDVPTCEERPDLAHQGNVGLTERVVDLARDLSVKTVVYAGTEAVYESSFGSPASEKDPVSPTSVYAQTKLRAESILFERLPNCRVVSLRQGTVSGPSPRIRLDVVLNAMVASGIHKGVIGVNVTAPIDRSLVHTSDLADAFALATGGQCEPGIYNCGGWSETIEGLALEVQATLASMGVSVQVESWTQEDDTRSYTMNSRKLKSAGWQPIFGSSIECIRDTASYVRAAVTKYSDPRYRNRNMDYEAIVSS